MRQTHALVIGVGDYPYLSDGALYEGNPSTYDFGQLTSSKISARTFYDWLLTRLNFPDAPLGFHRLVLSDGNGTASFDSIYSAFQQWYQACDSDQRNIGIFYFCGHGFQFLDRQLLLAEDFGQEQNRAFHNAIDFSTTWQGMYECSADTQLYIIDACREEPFSSLRAKSNPQELKSSTGFTRERDGRVLNSAVLGRKAFGEDNDISVFTKQLLRCLDGFGADRLDSDRWVLSTDSLSRALGRALRRLNRPEITYSPAGYDSNFDTDIHIVSDPRAFVTITCDPEGFSSYETTHRA